VQNTLVSVKFCAGNIIFSFIQPYLESVRILFAVLRCTTSAPPSQTNIDTAQSDETFLLLSLIFSNLVQFFYYQFELTKHKFFSGLNIEMLNNLMWVCIYLAVLKTKYCVNISTLCLTTQNRWRVCCRNILYYAEISFERSAVEINKNQSVMNF